MTECRYRDYFGNDITDAVVAKLNEAFPEFAHLIGSICIFPPSNNGGAGLAQWANVFVVVSMIVNGMARR